MSHSRTPGLVLLRSREQKRSIPTLSSSLVSSTVMAMGTDRLLW
uniref:Uncharacterized protein n=1 Tax=Anguilla anguilla TaxID=7936 RepID=A0A0E9VUZ2_ANGAN